MYNYKKSAICLLQFVIIAIIILSIPVNALCFPDIYMVGTMNNWEKNEDWKLKTTDGQYYTIENVKILEDHEFYFLEVGDEGDIIYGFNGGGWPAFAYYERYDASFSEAKGATWQNAQIPIRYKNAAVSDPLYNITFNYSYKSMHAEDLTTYYYDADECEGVYILTDRHNGDIYSSSKANEVYWDGMDTDYTYTEIVYASRIKVSINVDDPESFDLYSVKFDGDKISDQREALSGTIGNGDWVELPYLGSWVVRIDKFSLTLTISDYVYDINGAYRPSFELNDNMLTINYHKPTFYSIGDAHPGNFKVNKRYTDPIALADNTTVRAISLHNGSPFYESVNSDVASFTPSFTCDKPIYMVTDDKLTITSTSPNATIYYTTDGSEPTEQSQVYTAPIIEPDKNCVVKAIASAPNINPSEVVDFVVADYICSAPTINIDGKTVTITCVTEGTDIYYSLDGSTPDGKAIRYDGPFELAHNCVIKALSIKPDYFNSSISTETVDYIKAEAPEFELLDDGRLSIYSATDDAIIHYTIGGETPSEDSDIYQGPLTLVDNRVVKAIAIANDYLPSEVSVYLPVGAVCANVEYAYDGRYLTLTCETPDAAIYYTIDGTTPTEQSMAYSDRFDAEGIITIKAIAKKQYFRDSEEIEYRTPVYYDGTEVLIGTPGSLSQAFAWTNINDIRQIAIKGDLGQNDWATFSTLTSLDDLDLSEANTESVPDNALAGLNVRYISMPQDVETIGKGIFAGSKNLAAIKWNAETELPEDGMQGADNPNLLLYVKDQAYAPRTIRNVIVNNQATEITLTDSGMEGPFYCPERFRASRISYTHTYTQQTPLNTSESASACSGWETIALPFDVQIVKHESNGVILPFTLLNGDFSSMKPFWLYELTAAGFAPGTQIKANTPYLISMPNNLKYADEYVLAGDVTFEALNSYVPVTEANISRSEAYSFIPTLCGVERLDEVFAINNEEYPYFGYASGAVFVAGHRDVLPFEAYLSQSGMAARVPYIGISELTEDIESAMLNLIGNDELWKVYSCDGVLYIHSGEAQTLPLYNVSGRLIRMLDLNSGLNTIGDLEQGVYFIKHDKVMIAR